MARADHEEFLLGLFWYFDFSTAIEYDIHQHDKKCVQEAWGSQTIELTKICKVYSPFGNL